MRSVGGAGAGLQGAASMPKLVIKTRGASPMKYELTEESTVSIGRERSNSIVLASDAGISRVHARIVRVGKRFALEDAGSANGTRLNGKRIGRERVPLCSGDRIRAGSTEIVFEDPLSPRRGVLSRISAFFGVARAQARPSGPGQGFMRCSRCGATLHVGARRPGERVVCGRCKTPNIVR